MAADVLDKDGRSVHWDHVKEYMNIALPAITGLLGSAMGFYFGARNEQLQQAAAQTAAAQGAAGQAASAAGAAGHAPAVDPTKPRGEG